MRTLAQVNEDIARKVKQFSVWEDAKKSQQELWREEKKVMKQEIESLLVEKSELDGYATD